MAEWTGLEPATSRVTGGRSNQLNYHSKAMNILLEPTARLELATYRLQGGCSTN